MDRGSEPGRSDGIVYPPEVQPAEAKKDHPIWGIITAVIICGTILVAIQMLTNYHW